MDQFKTCRAMTIPTIPMSVPQACQHKYAIEFMRGLDDELLSSLNTECYRHLLKVG